MTSWTRGYGKDCTHRLFVEQLWTPFYLLKIKGPVQSVPPRAFGHLLSQTTKHRRLEQHLL